MEFCLEHEADKYEDFHSQKLSTIYCCMLLHVFGSYKHSNLFVI